mmetsp:Transcript_122271/g.391168  ORF Transcript_122271/g.391168 Transcript_122271/m.391168 type:complete len:258 (+) Transcript_122271:2651-3424(+)
MARAPSSNASGVSASSLCTLPCIGIGCMVALARMSATARGCVQYGSPDFRLWSPCASFVTRRACSNMLIFSGSPRLLGKAPQTPVARDVGTPSAAFTPCTHQRLCCCSRARRKSSNLLATTACAVCTSVRLRRPSWSLSVAAMRSANSRSTVAGVKASPCNFRRSAGNTTRRSTAGVTPPALPLSDLTTSSVETSKALYMWWDAEPASSFCFMLSEKMCTSSLQGIVLSGRCLWKALLEARGSMAVTLVPKVMCKAR